MGRGKGVRGGVNPSPAGGRDLHTAPSPSSGGFKGCRPVPFVGSCRRTMQPKTKSPASQIKKYLFEVLSLTKSTLEKRHEDA